MKFEDVGNGNAVEKIEKGEFHIYTKPSEYRTGIDLNGPWESMFRPGQTISMIMVTYLSRRPALCLDCSALCTNYTSIGWIQW